jgi:hypothetical protein
MWVTAFFGMITKFYTCSLAVMYRDKKKGQFVGGPMYVISKGLGKNWKFLAYLFCFFGFFMILFWFFIFGFSFLGFFKLFYGVYFCFCFWFWPKNSTFIVSNLKSVLTL